MMRRSVFVAVCTALLSTAACSGILQPPSATEAKLSAMVWDERDAGSMEEAVKKITAPAPKLTDGSDSSSHPSACPTVDDGFCYRPEYRSAEAYCRNLIIWGQGRYRSYAGWGGVLAGLGLAGTAASITWATKKEDDNNNIGYKVALATSTAVVTAVGAFFVKRSIAAAEAAGNASAAMMEEDSTAQWKLCRAISAKWLGANAESLKVFYEHQQQLLKMADMDAGSADSGTDAAVDGAVDGEAGAPDGGDGGVDAEAGAK